MKKKTSSSQKIRLNKFLADHGVASRRKADELIDEGLVQINGKTVYELGIKVDPKEDSIKVKGKLIKSKPQAVYFMFNKPKHVMTSTSDPQGRTTVMDFFKKTKIRIFPVGRLDWDTEGLLLMTNDGDFSHQIAHPTSKIAKTYHAKLDGIPSQEKLAKLTKGVSIVGGKVKASHVRMFKKGSDKKAWVEITITEGKNRQVRRMFTKIGFDVVKLKRISIGGLKLSGLKAGEHRALSDREIERLFKKKSTADKKEILKKTTSRKKASTSTRSKKTR